VSQKKTHEFLFEYLHNFSRTRYIVVTLATTHNRCFFKFGVEVGVELSIVNALYRLRLTDQLFKSYAFTRVVRSQSILQIRRQIKKNTLYLRVVHLCSEDVKKNVSSEQKFPLSISQKLFTCRCLHFVNPFSVRYNIECSKNMR
jgi:hypothetical protein